MSLHGDVARVPATRCPRCTHLLDATTGFGRDAVVVPRPGDVTLCAYCRTWLVFTDGLELREADPEEVNEVDPTLRQLAQAHCDAVDALRPKH